MFYLLEIILQVVAAFVAFIGVAVLISPAPVTILLGVLSVLAAAVAMVTYQEVYGGPLAPDASFPMVCVAAAVYLPLHVFLLLKAAAFLVNKAFPEIEAACDRLGAFVVESAERLADALGGAICFVATRPLATLLFGGSLYAVPKGEWYTAALILVSVRVAGRVAHRAVELRQPARQFAVNVVRAAVIEASAIARAIDWAADAVIYSFTRTLPSAASAAVEAGLTKAAAVVTSVATSVLHPEDGVSLQDAVDMVKECVAAIPRLASSAAASAKTQFVTASAAFCRQAKHASLRAASCVQDLPAAVPMAYAMGISLGLVQLLVFQAMNLLAQMAENPTAEWKNMTSSEKMVQVGNYLVKVSPSVASTPQDKVILCAVSWCYAMLCLYVLRPESFEFDLEDEMEFLLVTVPRRARSAAANAKAKATSTCTSIATSIHRFGSRVLSVASTARGQVVAGYLQVTTALQLALHSVERLPTSLTAEAAVTSFVQQFGGLSPRSWVPSIAVPPFVKKVGRLAAAAVVLCVALTYASSADYVNRCVVEFVFRTAPRLVSEAAASASLKVMNHVQHWSTQLLQMCTAIKVNVVAFHQLAFTAAAAGATKTASFATDLVRSVSSHVAAVLELVHEAAPRLVAFKAGSYEVGGCVLAVLVIALSLYPHLAVRAATSFTSKATAFTSKASAFTSKASAVVSGTCHRLSRGIQSATASFKTEASKTKNGPRGLSFSRYHHVAMAFVVLSVAAAAACWGMSSQGLTTGHESNATSTVAGSYKKGMFVPELIKESGYRTHSSMTDNAGSSPSEIVEQLEDAYAYVCGPSLAPVEEYVNMGIEEALSETHSTDSTGNDAAGSSPSLNVEQFQGPVQAPVPHQHTIRTHEITTDESSSSTVEPLRSASAPRSPLLIRSSAASEEIITLSDLLNELNPTDAIKSLTDLFDRKRKLLADVTRRWRSGNLVFLR